MKPTLEQLCKRLRVIAGHFSPYIYEQQELTREQKLELSIGAAEAADLIESLLPKPIEEAPKNEDFEILAFPRNEITSYNMEKHCYTKWSIYWEDDIPLINQPTHYIPLSAIQALMESGK